MHSFCVIPYHMIFTQNRFCDYHVLHIKCSTCLFLVFFEVCRSLAIFSHSNLALFPSINDTLRATSQISQISSVARFLVATCKLGLICVCECCSLINNLRLSPLINKYIDDGASNSISRWDDTFEDFSCNRKKLGGCIFSFSFLKGD